MEEMREVEPPEGCLWAFAVRWVPRSRPRKGIIAFCEKPLKGVISIAKSCSGERTSKLFIWDLENAEFLEGNPEVVIELSDPVPEIMRSSWGYYFPPPEGDYVLVARLGEEPVGMTYLNPRNGNLDYGVHVLRPLWRRRIGTSVLRGAAAIAASIGLRYLTVVRILGRGGDRRALAFYRANRPHLEYSICLIREGKRG